jgi:DNA-binding MarR family transcriptional regulator
MAYRLLIDGLHDRLRAEGWTDVRPAFGFVLLAAREQPTTSTELAALVGTTKQGASKLVDAMVKSGYVRRGVGIEDGRQRPVHITKRGEELLTKVEQLYAELEHEWAKVIGVSQVERLRGDLMRVVSAAHDGELPPVRPTW